MSHFPSLRSLMLALGCLSLGACSHSAHSHHDEASEAALHAGHDHEHAAGDADGDEHDSDEIVLSPADAARFGVGVEAVEAKPFADVVKAVGEIAPSVAEGSVAAAPTAGRLSLSPGVNVGTTVAPGQTIARIAADAVTGGNAEAVAKAQLDAAAREFERVKTLLADGLVTRKEYNEALAALEAARAAYSPAAASGVVKAVKGGVVTSLPAADGEIVAAGDVVAVISGASRLTLRALLPASQSSFLPAVDNAVISLPSGGTLSLADAGGRLMSKSPAGASATPGYIPVYFSFDAAAGVMPGSAVEVWLEGASASPAITVPREAVAEQLGRNFVYVKVDSHGYRKTPVTLGRSDGRRYEIASGLVEGDSVVTTGMTFVRLAETKNAVPEGHHHH